ncbi:MAG: response regulator [Thermodesulfobacteriota bacterium]
MQAEACILFVDDEPNVLRALERLFMDEEYTLLKAASGEEGLRLLAEQEIQLVISDYRMPGMNGVDFLKSVYERWPETVRIVLSGYADTAAIVAAINEGQIYKFIPKPWNDDELKVTIAKAVEVYYLRQENNQLTSELQQANEELIRLNEGLERRVQERTGEVLFQNRVLARSQRILDALPVAIFGFDDRMELMQYNRMAHEFLESGTTALSLGASAAEILTPTIVAWLEECLVGQISVMPTELVGGKKVCLKGIRFDAGDGQRGVILVMDQQCPP